MKCLRGIQGHTTFDLQSNEMKILTTLLITALFLELCYCIYYVVTKNKDYE